MVELTRTLADERGCDTPSLVASLAAVLLHERPEARVFADRFEVAILFHEAEVAITELDRSLETSKCQVRLLQECVAAREVVVCRGVGWSSRDELLVHGQAVLKPPLGGEVTGLDTKDFREERSLDEDPLV